MSTDYVAFIDLESLRGIDIEHCKEEQRVLKGEQRIVLTDGEGNYLMASKIAQGVMFTQYSTNDVQLILSAISRHFGENIWIDWHAV